MIETCRLKNIVIFIQTILSFGKENFVLSRRIINSDVPFAQKIWDSLACSCCSCLVSGSNFLLSYICPFCLGTVNKLSGKELLATAGFAAYKDGHEVCDGDGDVSMEDSVNDDGSYAPPIGDQGQENVNQSNALASDMENPVRLEVCDSALRKWAKIDLPKQ